MQRLIQCYLLSTNIVIVLDIFLHLTQQQYTGLHCHSIHFIGQHIELKCKMCVICAYVIPSVLDAVGWVAGRASVL